MTLNQEVLAVIKSALSDFDRVPLSHSVRTALRAARLLGDYENIWWLDWELRDGTTEGQWNEVLLEVAPNLTEDRYNELRSEYQRKYSAERAVWSGIDLRMPVPAKDKVCVDGVETIERRIRDFGEVPSQLVGYQNIFNRRQVTDESITAMLAKSQREGILERVGTRVYTYLTRLEAALSFTAIVENVLERHMTAVNDLIAQLDPNLLAAFTACYRRLAEGDDEALSHAATTCRRVLKSVADYLQPVTVEVVLGADGLNHKLDDANFINRLLFYVQRRLESDKSAEVAAATLQDLDRRLNALNDLASKGVHVDRFTELEASQCALQTFALLGDILMLGPSAT